MEELDVVSKPGLIAHRIEKALGEKGVDLPCPRCGNRTFSILDGVVLLEPRTVAYGILYVPENDEAIPLVVVFCNKCGYKFEHLADMLEVDLDSSEADKE